MGEYHGLIRGLSQEKCEFCTCQNGTWYGYDKGMRMRWGCSKHKENLQAVCRTAIFPRPKFYEVRT